VAAVVQKGFVPCIAVDLGTAVTFDVVVPGPVKPVFIGGSIAPGLAGMTRYLSLNTAQLPAVNVCDERRAIGRDTVEALQSGCLFGFCGMVREILNSIVEELGQRPRIVATGGDAELIAKHLHEIDEVDPFLTFRGLNVAAGYVG
jgi:type III pantothenate kinase